MIIALAVLGYTCIAFLVNVILFALNKRLELEEDQIYIFTFFWFVTIPFSILAGIGFGFFSKSKEIVQKKSFPIEL